MTVVTTTINNRTGLSININDDGNSVVNNFVNYTGTKNFFSLTLPISL